MQILLGIIPLGAAGSGQVKMHASEARPVGARTFTCEIGSDISEKGIVTARAPSAARPEVM